ncbi:MAG: glycosyltransferase [Selenomonadaceae bacterium]|nr:glycosyltransferase [Selenomonadaceae bacterium]
MEQDFAGLIAPNSKMVIEFISDEMPVSENTETKKRFLRINPNCNYIISNHFNVDAKQADTILFNSSIFATLTIKKLMTFIKKFMDKIKDTATVMFVLENLSYADNITALLNGQPPTVKATLTLNELQSALEQSDMSIIRTFSTSKQAVVSRTIVEMAKTKLNVDKYIVCAVKKSALQTMKRTLIQSYLGETLVCATIRVNDPNHFMALSSNVHVQSTPSGKPLNLLPDDGKYNNKILINQRVSVNAVEAGINMFNKIVDFKYLLIEEMDDNPIIWRKKYEGSQFINFIACHGLQTSTKPLADFFSQFNPHVKIFENQLKELPPARNFKAETAQGKPITIFFGALNREKDFAEILPAINKIAAEYGNNIAFNIIAKRDLFNSVESPNKTFVGDDKIYDGQYVPYNVYEQVLRNSHIALLPLRDTIFNRSKSDLKFIECAGNGAVVLASPTVYANSVKDGETGFIYKDVNEFYNKLKLLINNANKRYQIAENAYNYVKHNRLLSQHYEERWNWYNELSARLPELNAEVYKRIELLKEKGVTAFGGFKEEMEGNNENL